MNEIFVKVLLGIFSLVIMTEYIGIALKPKKIKYQKIFWLIALIISIILEVNSGIPFLNLFFSFLLIFLLCILGYEGSNWKKAIVSFSILAIWAMAELIVGYFTVALRMPLISLQIEGSILSKLLTLLLVECAKIIYSKYHLKEGDYRIQYWWILIMVPLCSIVIVSFIFNLTIELNEMALVGRAIFLSCLFFPLNLGIFKGYDLLIREFELRQKNVIYEENIRLLSKEMQAKEEALNAKGLLHDLNKHFMILERLAQQNHCQVIMDYIQNIKKVYMAPKEIISTGNFVIDTLINSNCLLYKKADIKYSLKIVVPKAVNIKDVDICIILGNALDNAYEATLNADNKQIDIAIVYQKNKMAIVIKNTYNPKKLHQKADKLISTKMDKENHGMGIELMKKVAEKYKGFFNIEYDGQFFVLVVTLYEPL